MAMRYERNWIRTSMSREWIIGPTSRRSLNETPVADASTMKPSLVVVLCPCGWRELACKTHLVGAFEGELLGQSLNVPTRNTPLLYTSANSLNLPLECKDLSREMSEMNPRTGYVLDSPRGFACGFLVSGTMNPSQ